MLEKVHLQYRHMSNGEKNILCINVCVFILIFIYNNCERYSLLSPHKLQKRLVTGWHELFEISAFG